MTNQIITILPQEIDHQLASLVTELQNLGISHVGHGLIYQGQSPTAYFSSKEWSMLYSDKELVSHDPIRECALKTDYRLISWDSILSTKAQRMVLEERKRTFQAKTGLLISIKTPTFHETFALGCDSSLYNVFHLVRTEKISIFDYLLKFRKIHCAYYSE